MADYGGEAAGGCCYFCVAIFQQYFSTTAWGLNWTCCDTCCQYKCCWDAGEFDPNDRPGAQQQQQETGPKSEGMTDIAKAPGEEDLPAYKPSEQMTIPTNITSQAAAPVTILQGQTGAS